MRMVYLTTVGAFLLSTTIAGNVWPIGLPGQCPHQLHHQQLSIVLAPVVKPQTKKSPLDWLMNMVSRVIEPFKRRQPAIVRSINLPGTAGRVYIRQSDDYSAWESNRVIIKMVTHDPATETSVRFDPSSSFHHSENSPQKVSKPYSFQLNRSPGVSSASSLLGYEHFSTANKFLNSDSSHHPTVQHHLNPHGKTYMETLNKYRPVENSKNVEKHHDSYSSPSRDDNKHVYQKSSRMPIPLHYQQEKMSLPSTISIHPMEFHQAWNNPELINVHHRRYPDGISKLQSNDDHSDGSGFLPLIPNQYSDDWSKGNKEDGRTKINITDFDSSQPSSYFPSTSPTHEHVIRTDRMVPNKPLKHRYRKRDRADSLAFSNWRSSPDFQQGPMIRFGIDDVRNSETIARSEVRDASNHEITFSQNENVITKPRNLAIHDRENSGSISKGNVDNVAHANSVKDIDINQTHIPEGKTYKTIDRSHRRLDNQNASAESASKNSKYVHRTNKSGSRLDSIEITTQKVDCETGKGDNFDVEDAHEVPDLTAGNRWRFQKGRRPTRVVKAVYRRQPIGSTTKLTRETMGRNGSGKNISMEERFSEA